MSSIPYNYGKYINDKVALRDQGHVSASKQIQSPASAGSRGLAKTTQFTNDRTQMQMGNSPIAESIIEIRNILNRIDGVNVPVQEGHYPHIKSFDKLYGIKDMQQYKAMADDAQSMDMGEFMDTYSSVIDMAGDFWEDHQKTSESNEGAVNEDPNTLAKELASEIMRWVRRGFDHIPADALKPKAKEYLSSIKESAVQEAPKDSDIDYAKLMLQISAMKDKIAELPIDDDRKTSALTALGQVEDDLAMDESAVREDEDDLSRLKELSGIREDAGLTDEQKKGLEAIAKKYKGREGYNGDFLPIGYIKAIMSTGVGTDGMDGEEVEAFAKKLGKDVSDIEDEWEDFETQDNITNAMKGDINDVLGNGWDVNQELADAAKDYLYDLDESYEPFPEEDEMTFEDDDAFYEAFGELGFPEDENELFDAEYRGRKVPLNKPMRGDVKKFKVYVKDPKSGNVKKVNFGHGGSSARKAGQKTMKIRKSNPKARKSFRARHNCANPGPKTKARYWSCRKW